jgi:hypothetical protein
MVEKALMILALTGAGYRPGPHAQKTMPLGLPHKTVLRTVVVMQDL